MIEIDVNFFLDCLSCCVDDFNINIDGDVLDSKRSEFLFVSVLELYCNILSAGNRTKEGNLSKFKLPRSIVVKCGNDVGYGFVLSMNMSVFNNCLDDCLFSDFVSCLHLFEHDVLAYGITQTREYFRNNGKPRQIHALRLY